MSPTKGFQQSATGQNIAATGQIGDFKVCGKAVAPDHHEQFARSLSKGAEQGVLNPVDMASKLHVAEFTQVAAGGSENPTAAPGQVPYTPKPDMFGPPLS